MSKIDVDQSDELDFVDGDSCVIISKSGEIRKIIVPKMDTAMTNSPRIQSITRCDRFITTWIEGRIYQT